MLKKRHPLSGAVYEVPENNGLVHVTGKDGKTGIFTENGYWVEGELGQADPHMCKWLGGRQLNEDTFLSNRFRDTKLDN